MTSLRIIFAGAVLILISGCSKPRDFDQIFDSTKKQVQSAVVRQAALPLFSLADTNLTSNSLPKEITSLPLFAAAPRDIQCWHLTTNALIFMTGGGFGHWGLVVCQGDPRPEDTKALHAFVTPWSDGILFFEQN
jgi:hypothetical protein